MGVAIPVSEKIRLVYVYVQAGDRAKTLGTVAFQPLPTAMHCKPDFNHCTRMFGESEKWHCIYPAFRYCKYRNNKFG